MLNSNRHFCSRCSFNDICLPVGLNINQMEQLESLVKQDNVQQSGDIAIHQGKPFKKIYAVRSGMYKSTRIDTNGREWILGFHLPGEIIGLDAIYDRVYLNTAVALNTSVLCALDFETLTELSTTIPALQKQLMRLMSKDINTANDMLLSQTAEQKLTSFIHNLLKRLQIRGYTNQTLILPMSRQDIASHLSLTPETLSRLLKQLHNRRIISINKRALTVLNEAALLELTGIKDHAMTKCHKQ